MRQIQVPVVSNEEIARGIYMLWLQAPEIAAIARPGQFVMLRCSEGSDPLLRRPFSIHRVAGLRLSLLFAVVGRGTGWLSQRRQGEILDILGPLGNGFDIDSKSRRLLLVAGGIGIAPLIYLAEMALKRGCLVRLLLGAETASQLYPERLLPKGIELFIATADGSIGKKGLVTELIPEFMGWVEQVFACGPIPMYRAMAAMGLAKSVQVLLEQMLGCGLGLCRGCAIETKQGHKFVCQDGPVFQLDDVFWEEIKEPVSREAIIL